MLALTCAGLAALPACVALVAGARAASRAALAARARRRAREPQPARARAGGDAERAEPSGGVELKSLLAEDEPVDDDGKLS